MQNRDRKTATETTILKKYPTKMDQYSYSHNNGSRKDTWKSKQNHHVNKKIDELSELQKIRQIATFIKRRKRKRRPSYEKKQSNHKSTYNKDNNKNTNNHVNKKELNNIEKQVQEIKKFKDDSSREFKAIKDLNNM